VLTGSQRLACETFYDHDHGQDVWSGEWPGVAECREFGWYATFVPDMGWLRCGRDDPGAVEDLNRLHMGEARWDPGQRRWVLTSTAGSRTATP
jgi:hypothetical protein